MPRVKKEPFVPAPSVALTRTLDQYLRMAE